MRISKNTTLMKLLWLCRTMYMYIVMGFLTASVLNMDFSKFDPLLIFASAYLLIYGIVITIMLFSMWSIPKKKTYFVYVVFMLIQLVLGSIYPYICTGILADLRMSIILTMVCLYLDIIFMMITQIRYIFFSGSTIYFNIWFTDLASDFDKYNRLIDGYSAI